MNKCPAVSAAVLGLLLLRLPFFASAQGLDTTANKPAEADTEPTREAPFSLIPILETVKGGLVRWRPDWPLDFPPDAFSPAEGRAPIHITLSTAATPAPATEERFSLRRDKTGRLREFPFFANGNWLRVTTVWGLSGDVAALDITNGTTDWNIKFPAGTDFSGSPAIPVQAVTGGQTFLVVFSEGGNSLSETWYDEGGEFQAFFRAAVLQNYDGIRRISSIHSVQAGTVQAGIEPEPAPPLPPDEYFFESGGGISKINSSGGSFSALYRKDRPVYWERHLSSEAAKIALQWDERGLLLGLQIPAELSDASPDLPVEYRYEYRLDSLGNWIRRQDIALTGVLGLFVPRLVRTWTRFITFVEE